MSASQLVTLIVSCGAAALGLVAFLIATENHAEIAKLKRRTTRD